MVAQLRTLLLVTLALGAFGCQGGGTAAASDPSMNTPSAPNGPKMEDWTRTHADNGAGGHKGER